MFEVRELRIVCAIHEHGSLARAARVLGVGQPALTRSLAAIEARVHGPLFERGRRGMTPTNLCRALLPEAGELLERLARLDRHIAEVDGARVRELSIAAGTYAVETVGMVAAARLLAAHPSVRVRLVAGNWADIPGALRDRKASLGLLDLSELGDSADFKVETLRPQPGIFVVRPGHPLTQVVGLQLADIMAWPFVFVGRVPRRVQQPFLAARETARAAGRLHPAFPALVHESPTIALTAVWNSDAVAAVTVPITRDALETGKLVALPWRAPWMSVQHGVICLRHHRATEVEDAFLDLLRTADHEAEGTALAFLASAGIDPAM